MAKRRVTANIDPDICFECGAPAYVDHYIIPKALGGKCSVPLCYSCYLKVHSVGGARIERIDEQPMDLFIAAQECLPKSAHRPPLYADSIKGLKGHPLNVLFWMYTLQFEAREGSLKRCGIAKFQKLADELNSLGLPTISGKPYTARRCRYFYAQMIANGIIDEGL